MNIFPCSWKYQKKKIILPTILRRVSNNISFCLSTYFAHQFQPASTYPPQLRVTEHASNINESMLKTALQREK